METGSLDSADPLVTNLSSILLFFQALDFGSIINLIVVMVLLFLSALVSGSEVAFFSLSREDIDKLKTSSESNDLKIVKLISHPKQLLGTILILNNLINVSIVTLTTITTWKITGQGSDSSGATITTLAFITTFLIVFFGEVIPKVYANSNNLSFSKTVIHFISPFNSILKPFVFILSATSDIIEKRFAKHNKILTAEEMHEAIDLTTINDDEVSKEEKDILKGIVNFGNTTAKQIMRSRIDIAAFDKGLDFHQLMDKINKLGYSRIPVYEDTIDQIVGILYIKDLLVHNEESENFEWQDKIREPFFIPEAKKINDLLKDFQQKRVHMAIVVDEYGGTAGLVTMEDVIEEIVGEINDEFDEDEINYTQVNDHTFIFEGKTSINDFSKVLEINSDLFEEIKGENESVGGMMLELFSKIPHVGDEISFENFTFKVQSVNTKRVKRIQVTIHEQETQHSQSA